MQVNVYPDQRVFKAIGVGEEGFVNEMVTAVSSVTGKITSDCISQRPSAKGKYISVTIGPVWVQNAEQVSRICNIDAVLCFNAD